MERILAINPGATSTKFAVYEGEKPLLKKTVEHSVDDLGHFARVIDQHEYRLSNIFELLAQADIKLETIKAVVGRGGLLKPLSGGTYSVCAGMLADLAAAERGEHASNLGAVMADAVAKQLGAPAFIVDPVSVDEMMPVARISGLPGLERVSMVHALNTKAVARKVAKDQGKRYEDMNMVVAHLGTGVSVTPHLKGRMIDVNNAKEEGPFSPDRCGGLPAGALVKLCFSGKYSYQELKEMMISKGGIYAYLGTKDMREVEKMADAGNEQAKLLLDALSYQIAKEIGAMATTLAGEVDCIILTGGIAYSAAIVSDVTRRVRFIAPVVVVPGEEELEALAFGALRVLRGEEQAQSYL